MTVKPKRSKIMTSTSNATRCATHPRRVEQQVHKKGWVRPMNVKRQATRSSNEDFAVGMSLDAMQPEDVIIRTALASQR
jgi:hypothetical protein